MGKSVINPEQLQLMDNPVVRPAPKEPASKSQRQPEHGTGELSTDPIQLKMLMSGQELQKSITFSNDMWGEFRDGTLENMWNRKLEESKEDSADHGGRVYASLRDKGFSPKSDHYLETRLNLYHSNVGGKMVQEGHHRIAAAAELERLHKEGHPEGRTILFPVVHYNWDS